MPAPCRPYEISSCIIPLAGERHKRGLRVSCPTWHHCVSYRQETVCEGFPTRRDTVVFLTDRKLFAKGFLPDVTLWCFLPAGNFSPIVSYSTWHCGVSYRQETFRWEISRLRFATLEMTEGTWRHCVSYRQGTVCEGFPTRRGTVVFLTGRNLFDGRFLDSASLRSK